MMLLSTLLLCKFLSRKVLAVKDKNRFDLMMQQHFNELDAVLNVTGIVIVDCREFFIQN